MIKKIKFAIVGFGFIGKRHAAMVKQLPNTELVAVVDTDPNQREAAAALGVSFYLTAEDLFASGLSIDVVCICTPNGFHAEQAILSLENNCHIVCEKPMGLSKASCEAVIYKALQMHKQIFCVMQNRYSPPSIWLKTLVESGVLGKIYAVQINCFWNRDDRYYAKSAWKGTKDFDGGPLFTQFSHFIDIMYWLFGDIKNIAARFANFNHQHNTEFEDTGTANFEFINGGMGTFNYSTAVWDANLESSLTILAENGSVKVGGQYMDKVEYCHIKDYAMPALPPSNPPNDYGHYKGSAANHHYIFQNVLETLQGKTTVTTNALEGLKVVEIIERIYDLKN